MRRAAALVVPLLVLAGCGGGGSDEPTPSSAPGATTKDTCVEVRAGIDAFNQADFAATVAHFEKAVPIAERVVKSDASTSAKDMLEAVRYYAKLAPDDYPQASLSSPDFAKYKAITLGQCESPGTEPPSDDPSTQTA